MPSARRAVFLDRDGTLIFDRGYMHRPSDLRLRPHVSQGLRELQARGFDLVLITKQSGIGRGLFSHAELNGFHRALIARLADSEIVLRRIYVCPHHPDAGCRCRKPGTALHRRAIRQLGLSPKRSFTIGDRAHDVVAGSRVGCRSVLLRTRYLHRELSEMIGFGVKPDFIAKDFLAAARWVVHAQ